MLTKISLQFLTAGETVQLVVKVLAYFLHLKYIKNLEKAKKAKNLMVFTQNLNRYDEYYFLNRNKL